MQMLARWMVALGLVAAGWLVAAPPVQAQAQALVYEEDFTSGPGGWLTNDGRGGKRVTRMRWSAEGFVRAQSPWWLDLNHAFPGAGALHLVALVHLGGRFGGLPFEAIDLRHARIELRLRQAQALQLNGAKLVFWFQTQDSASGKYVNYAYTRYDLAQALDPSPDRWRRIELRLDPTESGWTCLGATADRANTYGCSTSVARALARVDADFGLILLPVNDMKLPTGAIDMDDFALWLDLP